MPAGRLLLVLQLCRRLASCLPAKLAPRPAAAGGRVEEDLLGGVDQRDGEGDVVMGGGGGGVGGRARLERAAFEHVMELVGRAHGVSAHGTPRVWAHRASRSALTHFVDALCAATHPTRPVAGLRPRYVSEQMQIPHAHVLG